jgi:hypothetical protein
VPLLCRHIRERREAWYMWECRINNLRVINMDSGTESLPLRQIFCAFISNHLQRNSEVRGSAYGFQGFKVHSSSLKSARMSIYCNALRRSFISNIRCNSWLGDASKSKCS